MDKKLKETVKTCLKEGLFEKGILCRQPVVSPVVSLAGVGTLTFEQQKELLELQLRQQVELDTLRFDKEIQLQTMKQTTERTRLEVQQYQLQLVKDGKLSDVSGIGGHKVRGRSTQFDLVNNLRLVPKFSELDPDMFFSLFESIADARDWPDAERTVVAVCSDWYGANGLLGFECGRL